MKQQDIYRYTGSEAQLYGVRRLSYAEGRPAGAPLLQLYNAAGLVLDIHPATCMDIGRLQYKGTNISWISKNGMDSPSGFLPCEDEFAFTFPGGMLYTCGLRSVGPANHDGSEWHPLHGRIHSQPAEQVSACIERDAIVVTGVMRESAFFGHLLRIRRKITVPLWEASVTVEDTIENCCPEPQEFMLLYHYNFGYPLLSEHARLVLPPCIQTTPRDEASKKGLGRERGFQKPVDNEPEQVFFHELEQSTARLENPHIKVAATLCWDSKSLPVFAQWKSMASGDYVLGLEPSNCFIKGRSAVRDNGTLKTLGAFESIVARTGLRLETL